jgi:molybdenum cofactor synthesis domain-containing protein
MNDGRRWRIALLVLSDKAAAGQRQDECMGAMRASLPADFDVVLERVLPDDRALIERSLIEVCDSHAADCVLTSGGTGLGSRDVTPQATKAVGDYEVPGIAEAMRAGSIARVPTAMLSRAVAAVRAKTLIVNLPGSPRGARETLSLIAGVLPHALAVLTGTAGEHPRDQVR